MAKRCFTLSRPANRCGIAQAYLTYRCFQNMKLLFAAETSGDYQGCIFLRGFNTENWSTGLGNYGVIAKRPDRQCSRCVVKLFSLFDPSGAIQKQQTLAETRDQNYGAVIRHGCQATGFGDR